MEGRSSNNERGLNMENQKKIDTLFGLFVIAFLVVTIFVVNDFNAKRFNDQKEYVAGLAALIQSKNDKIIILSKRLAEKQREYDSLQKALVDTRNNLEALSKKLPEPSVPPAAATK